jgi:hypothetical protein
MPKSRFTKEEDELLIDLKGKQNLLWGDIGEQFPGRSVGTL